MLTDKYEWVAVMTWANAEALVASRLAEANIEYYLPMIQGRDLRFKQGINLEKPMFPNYLFAKINKKLIYPTRTMKGVKQIVSSNHSIIVVPQKDIDNVHAFEKSQRDWFLRETHKLVKGATVTITNGEFAGMQGRMVKNNPDGNFCVSITVMHISFLVQLRRDEIVANDLSEE